MEQHPPDESARWGAHPLAARLIKAAVFGTPIATSIAFVHVVSKLVPVPTSSFLVFIAWWVALSGAATGVLAVVDRVVRRLLPLAALFKLSLVFPDNAPSRFKTALGVGSVRTLEQRVAEARAGRSTETPREAAERLLGLVSLLDTHDALTRGHSDRVRAYAQMIGKELGLPEHDVELLNWAALLHDIGKLQVPTEILTKPGRPSDEEWEVLRNHPIFGAELTAPLAEWLGPWLSAVSDHHERWDGKGYPHGLEGDRITLAGRIVAVADVFDVITSARSYKSPAEAVEARAEIARCAGSHFDPVVVRAFLNVSLGRLRLAMGPLSWLAHAPILGRIPLTPAISTVSGTLATLATAAAVGVVADPPAPTNPFRTEPALAATVEAPDVARSISEDGVAVVSIPGVSGVAGVTAVRILGAPAVGRVTTLPGGAIRYVPPPDFHGVVRILYQACRGQRCRTGVVRVVVEPVNDPPVARPDRADGREDEPLTVDVLANDVDPDGDRLTVSGLGRPSVGRLERAGGLVRFVPPGDFNGTAGFGYTVDDGHGGTSQGVAELHITPVDDPPVAVDDRASVAAGGTVRIGVLENDSDPDGDGIWVADVSEAPVGKVTTDGSVLTYTAPARSSGTVRFRYTIATGGGKRATAAVEVAVAGSDSRPLAADDRATVRAGRTATLDVLANDIDPDGDALVVASFTRPTQGALARDGGRLRFTAPAGASGEVRFSYQAADAAGLTDTAVVVVTIVPVNVAPSFASGPDQAVLENAGGQRVEGWATEISPGPPGEAAQRVSLVVEGAGIEQLFSDGPEVMPDGTLAYTPAADANGAVSLTVWAVDDGGTANGGVDRSAPKTFRIVVRPVNSPPRFTLGPAQTVDQGSAAQVVAGWVSDIAPGPRDETSQAVRFDVSVSDPALFAPDGVPTIDSSGTLRYRPARGTGGSATVTVRAVDDGGSANGGVDTSAPQRSQIVVRGLNHPPTFASGGDVSVREDSGPARVAWASAIDPGSPSEAWQAVRFTTSTSRPGLFSSAPAVAANGTLSFTPAANASGVATVTVRAVDDGGSANGGVDTSAPQTFTITVTAVNDAPSFLKGADVAVLEDAGAQSVAAWATAISPGPADESGQVVSFTVTNDANSLFSVQPAVAANGTLSFTPAANASGVATVTVRAVDDGGSANGGVDTSAPQTFTITITAVNDAPSFLKGADVAVRENSGSRSLSGWATAMVAGPGESGQVVSFTVTNDANSLFSVQPAVAANGTLSFTPAANASGVATVTVRAVDDGGSANGGVDTSAPQTFTITITAVNDAPSFLKGADVAVLEDAGAQSVAAWATAISPGPADESGQVVSFTVTNDANSLFSVQPAVAANGTLSFTPAANASGVATVTVRAVDDGGSANGGVDTSAPQTFTITITAQPDPPAAVDDFPSLDEDSGSVTFDVLANDSDPDGDTVSLASFDDTSIANGTLVANGGGSFTYTPDPDFFGTDSFTYVVSDGNGGTDAGFVKITVAPAPDTPNAQPDGYATQMDTPLSVSAAAGLLGNDGDPDGDPLTVQVLPAPVPTSGSVTVAADGSFTYTPQAGFSGTATFDYVVLDGTGSSATATATITISAATTVGTYYLASSGPSPDRWDLVTGAPAVGPVLDWDGDLSPGLTIKSGAGNENESDARKVQEWQSPAPATVNGPVLLRLWSTVALFQLGKEAHPNVYLYDCDSGGGCVRLIQFDLHVRDWSGLVPGYVFHELNLGTLSHTFLPGHDLRLKLLVQHHDLWLPLVGPFPSSLVLTSG